MMTETLVLEREFIDFDIDFYIMKLIAASKLTHFDAACHIARLVSHISIFSLFVGFTHVLNYAISISKFCTGITFNI